MKMPARVPAVVQRLLERLGVRTPASPVKVAPGPTTAPTIPVTDDRVRADGGKPTDDQRVPEAAMAKIKENAVAHGKDEPGS